MITSPASSDVSTTLPAIINKCSELAPFSPEWMAAVPLELPGDPEKDIYICPVSGGADSSALAVFLRKRFPHVDWIFPFTDTGAEDDALHSSLHRLERELASPILYITGPKTLWEYLDSYGNYLPSAQSRWCTNRLKLIPFQAWIQQFAGRSIHIFVGIRFDESFRAAFVLDGATTHMPFVDLGWGRQQIFGLLSATIGIPSFYAYRSRSGCTSCPFMRRQEVVGLLQHSPVHFIKGAAREKLSADDAARHPLPVTLYEESGITANHYGLLMPQDSDRIDGRNGLRNQDSIFGERGIFVGCEFAFDAAPGMPAFCWKQRVVSYSRSLHGIKRQLDTRRAHLIATAEAQDMTEWEVRNMVRFAVYYIEVDSTFFDPMDLGPGSYTWSQSESYQMVRHIHGWARRCLEAAEVERLIAAGSKASPISYSYESAEIFSKAKQKIRIPTGRVAALEWYEAKDPAIDDELDERFITCPMCSV